MSYELDKKSNIQYHIIFRTSLFYSQLLPRMITDNYVRILVLYYNFIEYFIFRSYIPN